MGITSEDGGSFFEEHDAAHDALPLGGVPHAPEEVEDHTACTAEGKTVPEVVDDAVGTGLLAHTHLGIT